MIMIPRQCKCNYRTSQKGTWYMAIIFFIRLVYILLFSHFVQPLQNPFLKLVTLCILDFLDRFSVGGFHIAAINTRDRGVSYNLNHCKYDLF